MVKDPPGLPYNQTKKKKIDEQRTVDYKLNLGPSNNPGPNRSVHGFSLSQVHS